MGIKKLLAAGLISAGSVASVLAEEGTGTITNNTITMPQGVDIPALIQSGVLVLAGIVAVALAAWGSWLIVRKCLAWVRKAF